MTLPPIEAPGTHRGPATATAPVERAAPVEREVVASPVEAPRPARHRVRRTATAVGRWATAHGGVLLALAALVVPLVVLGVHALTNAWTPAGDWALMELRVRDVGADTPLVGPYSRYGWSHPGPLLFFLLVVPYRLMGEGGSALLAATALLNAACLVGLVLVARRRGGTALAVLTCVALAFLLHSFHPGFTWDPWNPYITLLPFGLFLVLAWAMADGDRLALPAVALVGTFLVQSHIGYAALVGIVGAWAAASLAWTEWRSRRHPAPGGVAADAAGPRLGRRLWPVLAATAAVLAVLWSPVVAGELRGNGNLGQIATFFTTDQEAVGLEAALPITAQELGRSDPPWIGGPEDRDPHGGGLAGRDLVDLAWPVAAFAVAAGLAGWRALRHPAMRRRAVGALRFQATALVAAAAGVYATARVTDTVYGYVVRWWWAIGMVWWLACAWSVLSSVSLAWRHRLRWVAAPAAGLVVAQLMWGVLGTVGATPFPSSDLEGNLGTLAAQAVQGTTRAGPVIVRTEGSFEGNLGDTLRNELDRAGVPVVVDPVDAYKYGASRSAAVQPPVATVWVVRVDAVHRFDQRQDLCKVAAWDPLEPGARAAYRQDSAMLHQQLLDVGRPDLADALARQSSLWDAHDLPGVDQAALDRVEEVRRREAQVAVYVGPPPDDYRSAPAGSATGVDAPGKVRPCPQLITASPR